MGQEGGNKHSEGVLVKEFCTQRKSKCSPCGNEYDKVVKSNASLAVSFTFPRLANKKTGTEQQDISQNAHHILCVAEVTKVVSKDKDLKTVLENNKYCINAEVNMIALPLFAHTVHWYCLYEGAGARETLRKIVSAVAAPPFQNLPNHDFDHGRYNAEVETELKKLKAVVKRAAHSLKPGAVATKLNSLSGTFRTRLAGHGMRRGGTHQSWRSACSGDKEKWYEPFSLATKPAERGFPGKFSKNLDRLQKAIDFLTSR